MEHLGNVAMSDTDYLTMIHHIEARTDISEIDQIRLSPFNPDKDINILTDGANSAGVGFVFYQNMDDIKPRKDVTIVNVNSSGLKESKMQYSPVYCEILGLKFATDAC